MGITIEGPNAEPGRHEESMSQRFELNKVHLYTKLALFRFSRLKKECS